MTPLTSDGLNTFLQDTKFMLKNIESALNVQTNKMTLSFQVQANQYFDQAGLCSK